MSKDKRRVSPATQVTHLGRDRRESHGFVNPPLYRASTVLFEDADSLRRGAQRYIYGRKGTPSTDALSQSICTLDGGALTLLAPSGLAAITTALLSLVEAGDHILMTDGVYWPARDFCDRHLSRLGITTTYYAPSMSGELADLVRPETRLIFTESPGSLSMEMQDLPAIAAVARAHGLWLVTDNSWGTSLGCKPLAMGADIAVQAGTKYITGHSDAMLGVITCNERAAEQVKDTYQGLGLCPGSEETFLGLRGLRTLSVRLKAHSASALEIARWLQAREEVLEVIYPPLPGARGHDLWKRDFTGSCGLFSIILRETDEASINAFLDAMPLFGTGWSWGGFESLAVPFNPANGRVHPPDLPPGSGIRFHIGLEDNADLIANLELGFTALAGTPAPAPAGDA